MWDSKFQFCIRHADFRVELERTRGKSPGAGNEVLSPVMLEIVIAVRHMRATTDNSRIGARLPRDSK